MANGKQELYEQLRKAYPSFIYHAYSVALSDQWLRLEFHFSIPGLSEFRPRWDIAIAHPSSILPSDPKLRDLVFSLGLVELISYWKLTCAPEIQVECGALSDDQSRWWKKLYARGLGEFFYTNGIRSGDGFVRVLPYESADGNVPDNSNAHNHRDMVLIPVGGGKDSAVTLDLFKTIAGRFAFMINPSKAALDTVRTGAISEDNVITAHRVLDKNMLDLNARGFLNGHTPFSALVAFSSLVVAYVQGIDFIALSNESSANESTVLHSDVNHQYSKSYEFETDFIDYQALYLSTGISYFSMLRPLSELGIAKIFSRLEAYHPVFRSCNVGSKNDVWCAYCPKCLFVYIILSPFLAQDRMVRIFGRNMLDDLSLATELDKLVGIVAEKPFECVGSRDEVNAALHDLINQYEQGGAHLPKLLAYYRSLRLPTQQDDIATLCSHYDKNNHVPAQFARLLKDALESDRRFSND